MILTNTAEGGTNGATVTTANSSGDSGQSWDVITISGSGSLTYSNAQVMNGGFSYHLTTTASIGQAYLEWSTKVTQPGKKMYMEMYCYFSSTFSIPRFFEFTNASVVNCGGVGITGSKFTLQDSAATVVATSATTIPLNQWIRIEMMIFSDATVGQMELKIFLTPTATSPTETLTTAATQNTKGDDIGAVVFGNFSNSVNVDMYLDDLAVQDIGYIGLNPYISNLHQNTAEGQANGTGLTRANSGASSGTAFDIVVINGSASVTFSNARSMHGQQSYLASCPSATDWFVLAFSNRVNDTTGAYRFYLYLNSFPAATTDISYTRNSSLSVAKVQLGTTGVLAVCDSTGAAIKTFSTFPLATGAWYRIEQQCVIGTSTTNGTINTQYFLGDSLTPIDNYSVSNANTGTALITDCRFGKLTTNQGTINAYFDDIAFVNGKTFPIGPASTNASTSWII